MGILKFKNKGKKEIYLTRSYNSVPAFTQYKDDAHFNDDQNQFSDYCFQVTCGTWQNDKIKILSLPLKGKLFYQTNPALSNPVYSPAFVGQMLTVRDLIDFRILKFNAEGISDNQFTGNYLTEFKIERFCGTESNNIIATVKLNMIDVQEELSIIYHQLVPQSCVWNSGTNPNNYTTLCTGEVNFTLAQKINISSGYIRKIYGTNSADIKIQKQNGDNLILNEILPVDYPMKAIVNTSGIPANNAYPNGLPSLAQYTLFSFEYSPNGTDNWFQFEFVAGVN